MHPSKNPEIRKLQGHDIQWTEALALICSPGCFQHLGSNLFKPPSSFPACTGLHVEKYSIFIRKKRKFLKFLSILTCGRLITACWIMKKITYILRISAFHLPQSLQRMIKDWRSMSTELKFMIRETIKIRHTTNQDCEFSFKTHLYSPQKKSMKYWQRKL